MQHPLGTLTLSPVPLVPRAAAVPLVAQVAVAPLTAPQVIMRDGKPVTTSRAVAEFFGKEHRNVMQSIDSILKDVGEIPPLTFQQGYYTLPSTGSQQHREFTMDRDGFMLLAMGFTGADGDRLARAM